MPTTEIKYHTKMPARHIQQILSDLEFETQCTLMEWNFASIRLCGFSIVNIGLFLKIHEMLIIYIIVL